MRVQKVRYFYWALTPKTNKPEPVFKSTEKISRETLPAFCTAIDIKVRMLQLHLRYLPNENYQILEKKKTI
jgi:hypothetical protein